MCSYSYQFIVSVLKNSTLNYFLKILFIEERSLLHLSFHNLIKLELIINLKFISNQFISYR